MTISDNEAEANCRARSAARHARARRGALGKVALPNTAKGEEARHTAHWKYWKSVVLRIAANNHRFDVLTKLDAQDVKLQERRRAATKATKAGDDPPGGMVEQAGLKRIYWPQYWEDYSVFKHHTYNNDDARTCTQPGMSLIYHKGQRITSRTQSGDKLNNHNYAWMWGMGANTSSAGELGTAEFL